VALSSFHETEIGHEDPAVRCAWVHKPTRAVLLKERGRAQSALFGSPVRQAPVRVHELECPADWVGPPNSQVMLLNPTRYPVWVDRDSACVDIAPPGVYVAGGN